MQAAVIKLSIRATEIALRPSYRIGIAVDNQPIVAPRSLALGEAQVLHGLARQYAVLWSAAPEAAELVDEQQRALGVALFNVLLRDAWDAVGERISPGSYRTLVIDSDRREILDLPWALLRPPGRTFLADDPRFAVVLRPPSQAGALGEPEALPVRPLRVLFMACAPGEDGPVLREECAALRATAFAGPQVELAIAELGTAHELAAQLGAFRPHLLHLSGPCRVLRRCPTCRRCSQAHSERCSACNAGLGHITPAPCFGFEDAGGEEHWVGAGELRAMLIDRGVRCVWLTDWDRDAYAGAGAARLCEALACAELPFAIGWSCSLGATGAARLAAGAYAALAAGLPVDAALAQAKTQAHGLLARRPNWPAPTVVAMRSGPIMATTGGSVADAIARGQASGTPAVHAAHAAGRRRQVGEWLAAFRSGELRTLMLAGGEGVGQREIAAFLTRRAVQDGLQPLRLPSSPDTPLTTARLLYSAASALRPHDAAAAGRLLERREPVGARLGEMLRLLARHSFVLVLDRFEHNLHAVSGRVVDPWLAELCAGLRYGRADTPRTILTSSVVPPEWDDVAAPARVDRLTELGEEAFLAFLLHDPKLAAAVDNRQLSRRLIHELYWRGGCARWPEQTQAVARLLPTDELEQLAGVLQSRGTASNPIGKRADVLFGCLYQQLSVTAREALPRSSIFYAPVGQAALAAAAAVDRRSTGALLREWRSRALADVASDDRWSVAEAARSWLLAPPRLAVDERRGALVNAADYLVRHVAERVRTVSTGAELDYWMEARAKYVSAADEARASEATRRVERVLERWGLPDDIEHLHRELQARFAPVASPAPGVAETFAPSMQQLPARSPRVRVPVV